VKYEGYGESVHVGGVQVIRNTGLASLWLIEHARCCPGTPHAGRGFAWRSSWATSAAAACCCWWASSRPSWSRGTSGSPFCSFCRSSGCEGFFHARRVLQFFAGRAIRISGTRW